jgi:hypothetical protein
MGRRNKGSKLETFPFGTYFSGLNISWAGLFTYLWELLLIVICLFSLLLKWEAPWLIPALFWAGGPTTLLIAIIAGSTMPKPYKIENNLEGLKIYLMRKTELVHFLTSGITQTILGVSWIVFTVHYDIKVPPIDYQDMPESFIIQNVLFGACFILMFVSFFKIFDTNLVKEGFFEPMERKDREEDEDN